jgi:AMP-binding enzyme
VQLSFHVNWIHTLRERVELQPGVPALIDHTFANDRVISFSALNRFVDFISVRLREEKIASGSRVLVLMERGQEFYALFLALLQIGAIPMLYSEELSPRDLSAWLQKMPPDACVLPKNKWLELQLDRDLRRLPKKILANTIRFRSRWLRLGRMGSVEESEPGKLALMFLARGPDGGLAVFAWTHRQLAKTIEQLVTSLKLRAGEIDFCDRPLQLLANLSAGLTSVVPVGFHRLARRSLRRQIDKFKPTRSAALSSVFRNLIWKGALPLHRIFILDAPLDQPSIEFFSGCANHADVELIFGADAPLAAASLAEHRLKGTSTWVGEFFDNVRFGTIATEPDDNSGSLKRIRTLPPEKTGELVVSSDFLPLRLHLDGAIDFSKVIQLSENTFWLKTGVRGHLDTNGKFWVDQQVPVWPRR